MYAMVLRLLYLLLEVQLAQMWVYVTPDDFEPQSDNLVGFCLDPIIL